MKNIEYIEANDLLLEEKINLLEKIKNDITASEEDINNNIPLYYYGHQCDEVKLEHLQKSSVTVKLNNNIFYVNRIYTKQIQLSNHLLNILINQIAGYPCDIDWVLLTPKQIKKYIYHINKEKIFKIYTELEDAFIKNLIDSKEGRSTISSLLYNKKLSTDVLDWLFANKKQLDISYVIKNQILSEDLIIKYLNLFKLKHIDILLKYQNISESTKNKLLVYKKLM